MLWVEEEFSALSGLLVPTADTTTGSTLGDGAGDKDVVGPDTPMGDPEARYTLNLCKNDNVNTGEQGTYDNDYSVCRHPSSLGEKVPCSW